MMSAMVTSGVRAFRRSVSGVGDRRWVDRRPLLRSASGRYRRWERKDHLDFAARDNRHFGVQEFSQSTQDAALGLATQPQKNEIVLGKESINDARCHRILVTDNARKEFLAGGELSNQIIAEFILDGSIMGRLSLPFEFSKRCWFHRVILDIRRICRV